MTPLNWHFVSFLFSNYRKRTMKAKSIALIRRCWWHFLKPPSPLTARASVNYRRRIKITTMPIDWSNIVGSKEPKRTAIQKKHSIESFVVFFFFLIIHTQIEYIDEFEHIHTTLNWCRFIRLCTKDGAWILVTKHCERHRFERELKRTKKETRMRNDWERSIDFVAN